MNEEELKEICEALQSFIVLKRQNLLIYSWMEFKKQHRRTTSIHDSRSKSQLNGSIIDREALPLKSSRQYKFPNYLNRSQKYSTPKLYHTGNRLVTEQDVHNHQEEMFETFNRNPLEGKHHLTEQHSHNYLRQDPFRTEQQEADFEDSEEFEDIVLDRLSKLEENINMMMRERKIKDQRRGYVGTPINPYIHSRNDSPFPSKNMGDDSFYQLKQQQSIKDRKRKFFQMIKSSPSKESSFEQPQRNQKDIIYNLKYIPVGTHKEPYVNIQKIKQIIQNNHQHERQEEENFIDDVDFFNQNRIPRLEDAQWKGNYRSHQNTKRESAKQDEERMAREVINIKERASSELYMNRYGISNTTRNNQIHFVPNHIENQTVIESRGKYFRHNPNHNKSMKQEAKKNENSFERPYFKAKGSKISNSSSNTSRVSYQTSKLNNLSAYY